MSVRRYYSTKDTTIANADFPSVGTKDISGANLGASEILNLYLTVEQSGTASILIAFPSYSVPAGGQAWLHLGDAQHSDTLPYGYNISVRPLEQDWTEGNGHDLDFYTDTGSANWLSATLTSSWVAMTGTASATFLFQNGHEDLDVDISALTAAFGFRIDIVETGSDHYIKKFHSRQTHFFERRPFVEVRAADWTGTLSTSSLFQITASNSPWYGYYVDPRLSGTISGALVSVTNSLVDPAGVLDLSLYDLKTVYSGSETPTLHLRVRQHDYNPAAVSSASLPVSGTVLSTCYYGVFDDRSGEALVPFGTGSIQHTRLSYDDFENFFNFRMDTVPPGKVCRFDFLYQVSGSWTLQRGDNFKFRVE